MDEDEKIYNDDANFLSDENFGTVKKAIDMASDTLDRDEYDIFVPNFPERYRVPSGETGFPWYINADISSIKLYKLS